MVSRRIPTEPVGIALRPTFRRSSLARDPCPARWRRRRRAARPRPAAARGGATAPADPPARAGGRDVALDLVRGLAIVDPRHQPHPPRVAARVGDARGALGRRGARARLRRRVGHGLRRALAHAAARARRRPRCCCARASSTSRRWSSSRTVGAADARAGPGDRRAARSRPARPSATCTASTARSTRSSASSRSTPARGSSTSSASSSPCSRSRRSCSPRWRAAGGSACWRRASCSTSSAAQTGIDVLPSQSERPFGLLVWQILFVPGLVARLAPRAGRRGLPRYRGTLTGIVAAVALVAIYLRLYAKFGLDPLDLLTYDAARVRPGALPQGHAGPAAAGDDDVGRRRAVPRAAPRRAARRARPGPGAPAARPQLVLRLHHARLRVPRRRERAGARRRRDRPAGNALVQLGFLAGLWLMARRGFLFRWVPR